MMAGARVVGVFETPLISAKHVSRRNYSRIQRSTIIRHRVPLTVVCFALTNVAPAIFNSSTVLMSLNLTIMFTMRVHKWG